MFAINIDDDDLQPAGELLKAKLGHRITPGTLWRWHRQGTRGCRLACLMVGGVLHTTPQAVAEFIRGQNPEFASPTVAPGSCGKQKARSASTARRLKAA